MSMYAVSDKSTVDESLGRGGLLLALPSAEKQLMVGQLLPIKKRIA
jgi:hypothetical protein